MTMKVPRTMAASQSSPTSNRAKKSGAQEWAAKDKDPGPRVTKQATEAEGQDHVIASNLVTTTVSRMCHKRTRHLKIHTKAHCQYPAKQPRQYEEEAKIQLLARHPFLPSKLGYSTHLLEVDEEDAVNNQHSCAKLMLQSMRRVPRRAWLPHEEEAAEEEEDDPL